MKHIAMKITVLSLGALVALSVVFGVVLVSATGKTNGDSLDLLSRTLHEDFDRLVRTQVEHASTMLQGIYDKSQAGEMTLDEAKKLGADLLRQLRYDKEGYFWADTTEGINVVLLGKADVEGKSRWESKDAQGKLLVQEIIKSGMQEGGGFTDYWFPRAGQTEPLPKRSYSLLFEPFGWVIGTGNYIDDIQKILDEKKAVMDGAANTLKLIVLLIILLALAVSGAISWLLGKRISVPIRQVANALDDIAQGEGDLTRQITVNTRDETAEISQGFNLFTEKLSRMILSLRESIRALSELGQSLSSNLVESASALNQITANIGNMQERINSQSASVSETSATMEEISKGIDSLNGLIEVQSSSVSHSSAAIEQMVSNIASVAANVDRISSRFENLTTASDTGKNKLSDANRIIREIEHQSATLGEANTVIANIAAQTNLLAMNAAIEAAHAGESGRGFSVVADEIRKLAENASTQSRAVAENIKTIRASIVKVVAASGEAEKAFDETRTMIQEVNELESNVKLSMVEQNEGSKQILQALAEINKITGDVRSGSGKMAAGSRQIREEMVRLAHFTSEIRGGMGEISQGASEINLAINGISDLGVRNKEYVDNLSAETERFKVRE